MAILSPRTPFSQHLLPTLPQGPAASLPWGGSPQMQTPKPGTGGREQVRCVLPPQVYPFLG